jgi:hypothetical protein
LTLVASYKKDSERPKAGADNDNDNG